MQCVSAWLNATLFDSSLGFQKIQKVVVALSIFYLALSPGLPLYQHY